MNRDVLRYFCGFCPWILPEQSFVLDFLTHGSLDAGEQTRDIPKDVEGEGKETPATVWIAWAEDRMPLRVICS